MLVLAANGIICAKSATAGTSTVSGIDVRNGFVSPAAGVVAIVAGIVVAVTGHRRSI